MIDSINFTGYFKIQSIDAQNNVIDEWEDKNLIMQSARESMAEILSGWSSSYGINKFVLGSKGNKSESLFLPKTATEGLVNTRDRLFSETLIVNDTSANKSVLRGDVVKYEGTANANAITGNYYEYIGDTTLGAASIDYNIVDFTSITQWKELFTNFQKVYNSTTITLYTNDIVNYINGGIETHYKYLGETAQISIGNTNFNDELLWEELESLYKSVLNGDTVELVNGDIISYKSASSGVAGKFYKYIGTDGSIVVGSSTGQINPALSEDFETYIVEAPYTYTIEFSLPDIKGQSDQDAKVLVTSEDDITTGTTACEVLRTQEGTSVTYQFDIAASVANGSDSNGEYFTEAAMYANDRIFAMKTFKAKDKDETVLLRIIWTITF